VTFEPLQIFPHQTVLRQGNAWLEIQNVIDGTIDLVVLGSHPVEWLERWY
jgi:hypothetical protein